MTALTGVEAISNGVSAFREPQARNALPHLVGMAAIMAFCSSASPSWPPASTPAPSPTATPPWSPSWPATCSATQPTFIAIQVATLLILVLAANTSFSSFPLLASFAADDAILPRQLRKRGHRLVYSNGILVLSAAAVFLVVTFEADTHHLIPLYAIRRGHLLHPVPVRAWPARHLRLREPGWRRT